MIKSLTTDTPCVGICSTVYGDIICRGCKRTYQEVINWNQFSVDEKANVYHRLADQTTLIVTEYLEITDPLLLQTAIKQLNIKIHEKSSSAEQVFALLRYHADKMNNVKDFGFVIKKKYERLSLSNIFHQMDNSLYQLVSTI